MSSFTLFRRKFRSYFIHRTLHWYRVQEIRKIYKALNTYFSARLAKNCLTFQTQLGHVMTLRNVVLYAPSHRKYLALLFSIISNRGHLIDLLNSLLKMFLYFYYVGRYKYLVKEPMSVQLTLCIHL